MTAQPDSQPLTNEALERLINVEAALDRLTAALVTGRLIERQDLHQAAARRANAEGGRFSWAFRQI